MRIIIAAIATLLLTEGAQAQAIKASFDCAKARSPAEKKICSNAANAKADLAVANAYSAALKRLDEGSRKALQDDQKLFVGARDFSVMDGGATSEAVPLKNFLEIRAEELNGFQPGPNGFVGNWTNTLGRFDVEAQKDGSYKIEGNTSRAVTHEWSCTVQGTAKVIDGVLTLVEMEDGKPNGWKTTLQRKGDALFVDQAGAADAAVKPPSCGGSAGHMDGTYFFNKNAH